MTKARAQIVLHGREVCYCTWTLRGPDDVGERYEQSLERLTMWFDQSVGEEMESEISVLGIFDRLIEIDFDRNLFSGDATNLIGLTSKKESGIDLWSLCARQRTKTE